MSILQRQPELPMRDITPPKSVLPYAPLSERDKAAAWLYDMYKRKRKPLQSLMCQADATGDARGGVISDVVIACRPGGHSPELEEAKAKFMRDYRTTGRKNR